MLDDQAMEKKPPTRCSLQGAKGGNAETKFKQDAITKFTRGPRRKESPSQRSEPPRKGNPQKNKTANDKRPRPRGTINFGDRSEVVEDEILEVSVTKAKAGSRKVNLNHLLNFTFASRETASDFHGSRHGHRAKVNLPRFNKKQFLQANCQFVVLEGGDYSVHSADPDTLVDWHLIEEVRLPCHEVPSCPICLYPATAAKITCCGHIYCWACILHYLSLSDRSWSKCPICYEAVHIDDLKSVISMARPAPKVNEEIHLTLMRRERGSLFVLPATQWKDTLKSPLSISDDPIITPFQKLLIAKKDDILIVLRREHDELQAQLKEENPEQCFIESALDLLQKRQLVLINKFEICNNCEKLSNSSDEENRNTHHDEQASLNTCGPKTEESVATETGFLPAELETIFTDEEQTSLSHSEDDKQNGTYFFYQASDGQQVYMHSINVRMLVKEYGSLKNCPPEITANVMELETVTMTEPLRKRLRYLQHLPLTCVFQVAELQLKQPLISQSTVTLFNAEVQKRHRARSRKAREEKRRDRHIELEQNKKIGKFPSARYSLNSLKQFPVCNSVSTDEDPPLTPDEIRSPSPASVSTLEQDQDDASSVGSADYKQTSFAKMLRDGKARAERSTIQESPKGSSSSTVLAVNSDGEECAPAPDFHVTFGDALQAALSNMALRNPDSPDEKKAGKRKKAKKTLLFTTSMSRSK